MPIIYKCDRCGQTFSPENKPPMFMPNMINPVHKYILIRSDGNSDFAVCQNCLGELEEWFDKKPKNPREVSKQDHSFPKPVPSPGGYVLSSMTSCAACDDYIKGVDLQNECKNS